MTQLYKKITEQFNEHDGALAGYMEPNNTPLAIYNHYDLRAFHTDDVLVSQTILDMQMWNVFHFTGMTMDQLSSRRSTEGRVFRRRTMTEADTALMSEFNIDSMFDIDFVVVDAGNEEWPSTDSDVTVGPNSLYRYANTFAVNLYDGVTKEVVSHYPDDILTDFNEDSTQYFITLILRGFPAQTDPAHLDLTNSFIDFSSSDAFDPLVTDSVPFSLSLNNLSGGGDLIFKVTRDLLVNSDLANIRAIKFRLLSVGNMVFTAQAMRLIPDYFPTFDRRDVYTDTKKGYLTRQIPLDGSADLDLTTTNDSIPFVFNTTRPENTSYSIEFNTGHNPTGHDNIINLYLRYDTSSGDNINIVFLSRDTQSRIRLYETIEGVTTEIYSTSVNTNILTPNTDYILKVDLFDDKLTASIYNTSGVFYGSSVYTTGEQVTTVSGRGYVGYSLLPYNYDFTMNNLNASNAQFALFESSPFLSITPVRGATLLTQDSGNLDLLEDIDWEIRGDSALSIASIGKPTPSTLVTRDGTQWLGGMESVDTILIENPNESYITGDIYPASQVRGLYRIALVDANDSVGFITYIEGLVPNQWNSFSIPITIDDIPHSYRVIIHQAGFYNDLFYLDNVKLNHTTITWSASSDQGNTWQGFLSSINKSYSGVNFSAPSTSIKLRAAALTDTAWIAGYELQPKYGYLGH